MTTNRLLMILIVFILLLFTVMLFHVGRHTRSNRYLGVYFISQILVLVNLAFNPFYEVVFFLLQSIIFSWGAFYYLFVSSLLDRHYVFKPIYLLQFIPVPVGFFLLLADYYFPANQFLEVHAPFLRDHSKAMHNFLFNGLIIGYNIATVVKYYHFRKDVTKGVQLKNTLHPVWLNISIWGFIVSCLCNQTGNYLNLTMPDVGFDWMNIGLAAFLIYFCVLFYVAVSSRILLEKYESKEKYKNSKLPEAEAIALLASIEHCITEKRLFTNQELKLKDLAEQLTITERTLSQLINFYRKQNFSDFINSYRIEYAKQLLADPLQKDKTILWILFESGFNSKATFNTLFKKVVGCTPAEYRKTLR